VSNCNSLHSSKVQVNYQTKGHLEGSWSKDALLRIIENLFNNAVKYGAADSPTSIL